MIRIFIESSLELNLYDFTQAKNVKNCCLLDEPNHIYLILISVFPIMPFNKIHSQSKKIAPLRARTTTLRPTRKSVAHLRQESRNRRLAEDKAEEEALLEKWIAPPENNDSDDDLYFDAEEDPSLDDSRDSDYADDNSQQSSDSEDMEVEGQLKLFAVPEEILHRDVVVAKLTEAGFDSFLQDSNGLGGNRKSNAARQILRKFAGCISDIYYYMQNRSISEEPDIFSFLKDLIVDFYDELPSYFARKSKGPQGFKPKTVINHVDSILEGVRWFVLFRKCRRQHAVSSSAMIGFDQTCKRLKQMARKADKRLRAGNTLEEAVYNLRAPRNGLRQLADAVDTEMARIVPAIEAALKASPLLVVKREFYNRFMGLIYAALYTGASQGRIGGILDLKYGQRQELLKEGYTTTTKFKTGDIFMYQPITLPRSTRDLVKLYIKVMRPMVCRNGQPKKTDPFWLNYMGKAETRGGAQSIGILRAHSLVLDYNHYDQDAGGDGSR